MSHLARAFTLFILFFVLTACQSVNITDGQKTRPNPPTPSTGKGVMTGQVLLKSDQKPIPEDTPVRLAQVFRKGGEGAFVLDLGHSPSSLSKGEGFFTIIDITPAEYLLIVGRPEDSNYEIYQNADGKPFTYNVEAGKTIDLGTIKVEYNP